MSAYARKKDPEGVRRKLLDCAAWIIADGGAPALTIQAVAEAAGVTKGGLLHHFQSRQILLEALFADLLRTLDAEIDDGIAADDQAYGSFTRAYLTAMARLSGRSSNRLWAALALSMQSEKSLRALWSEWLSRRLERHAGTDGDPSLSIVRYAADGIWLADLMEEGEIFARTREQLLGHLHTLSRRPVAP